MLTAAHVLIYADDPEAARAFFRDALEWPCVDSGGGWLIFQMPPSELGVHPTDGGPLASGTTKLSLMCDDLEATLASLAERGVEVLGEPRDARYGIVATIRVPGGVELDCYEPRHATAYDLG
jgi:predicted enzyme related to lactoylglutathione lyase